MNKPRIHFVYSLILFLIFFLTFVPVVFAQEDDPFNNIEIKEKREEEKKRGFFGENFFFIKEFMTFYGIYETDGGKTDYKRQIIAFTGFEIYKKFSSTMRDIGDLNLQIRLIRTQYAFNAPESSVNFQIHNAYLTLNNPLGGLGKFHFRTGHIEQPFGLETSTDTHGTLLQLSNIPNFGFKQDWGMQAFGDLSSSISYNVAYTLGSGHHWKTGGQKGIFWTRFGTTGRVQSESNFELGLSAASGKKFNDIAHNTSDGMNRMKVKRAGIDYRLFREPYLLTFETSIGKDDEYDVRTLLGQLDYIDPGNRWQASLQYRNFYRDLPITLHKNGRSLSLEFDWFFRNSLRNKEVIRLNYSRFFNWGNLENSGIFMIQYYLYY